MVLFDIKCFILVTIFENILVLEGLKKVREHVSTPYRSFYLRNERRHNNFDYSFKDWETTTPDADYVLGNKPLNITENHINNQTLPKEEIITMVTNVTYSMQTVPTVENLTILTQETVTSKQEVTSNTESTFMNQTLETAIVIQETNTTYVTNSTLEVQNSSSSDMKEFGNLKGLNVTLPSEATIKDVLEWLATTSITEYTTVIPPPPTINVEDLVPALTNDNLDYTMPLLQSTEKNSILAEIKEDIKKKHGYFTSSIHGLLIVLSHKSSRDFTKLLTATNTRIDRFLAVDALAVFGKLIVEVFQSVLQMLILAPDDVRKEYINFAIYSVENRHTAMRDDVNAVFDVIDNIYTDETVDSIGINLKKIEEFPNKTTDVLELVTDTLNAFIFTPHNKIIGTTQERLLLMEINNVLQNRLYPGHNLGRRYIKRKEHGKFTRPTKSAYKITDYQENFRKQSKYTTINTHNFKNKSKTGKIKDVNIKGIHNDFYRNAKNKYDANKIATPVKNFYSDSDEKTITFETSLQFYSASSESSCSHNDSSGYNLESRYNYKSKTVNDKNNFKINEKHFKAYNKDLNNNKPKYKLQINKMDTKNNSGLTHASKQKQNALDKLISEQSAEENILKLNLIDALIHSGKMINRRNVLKGMNKLRDIESNSDDEAILKSNIYKVFRFSNDFRKQL